MRSRRASHRQAGYTLVELLLALALLSVIIGSIAMIGGTGTDLFKTSAARGVLEANARRALDRIRQELLSSDLSSLDTFPAAPLWDDGLTFDQPEEYSSRTGSIDWSSTVIEFRYDDGETDDGIDNDGDELVDEGIVVLIKAWNDPEERTVVLARNVREYLAGETANGLDDNGNGLIDERGLCFDLSDGNLSLHLTLERRDTDHVLFARTLESSVWLRN
jgi:prepilin-type N-terminal cleavage/methylation domain-containing protein